MKNEDTIVRLYGHYDIKALKLVLAQYKTSLAEYQLAYDENPTPKIKKRIDRRISGVAQIERLIADKAQQLQGENYG